MSFCYGCGADNWLNVGASFVPDPRRNRRRDARDHDTESLALQVVRKSDSRHESREKKHREVKKKKSSRSSSKRDDSNTRDDKRSSRKRQRASSSASDFHSSSASEGEEKGHHHQQLVRYKEHHLKTHKKSKKKKKKKSSSSRRRRSDSSASDSSGGSGSHSKKERDHKRLRGDEDRVSSYSRAVVASVPKEVQVWMQQAVQDDDTFGSTKLFEFDCAGDNENRFYGTLYAQDKPLYTLATRRNLFTGAWLVERKPVAQQQQLSGDREAKKAEKRTTNRYFGPSARQMEKDARQQRLYLAYSEKRLARQRGDPGGSTELVYIPLDPVLESTNAQDGDEEELRTETANVEQYLVTRSKLFNEAIKKNPRDIDTWLDFVAFQEQALRLTRSSKNTSMNSSSLSAMVMDKQSTILEKAIEANPDNRELQLVKLKLAMRNLNTVNSSSSNGSSSAAARDHETLRTQLEALIEKDPTNGDLWSQLVATRQQNFASFSVPLLREQYARIIAILRKELVKVVQDEAEKEKREASDSSSVSSSSVLIFDSGSLLALSSAVSLDSVIETSERARELMRLLLEFHLRLCLLEQKTGYNERAIAQVQALIDFSRVSSTSVSSLGSGGSSSEHRHSELREFAARWDQNLPHFGDDTHDLAAASTFSLENAYLPPSEALKRLVHENQVAQMSTINPPEAIQSREHQQSLLRLASIHQRTKGSISLQPGDDDEADDSDEDEFSDEPALIYSNVHGYRIKLDEIDDTSEYERILSELRGTEASIARRQTQGKKKEQREAKSAKALAKFHDERVDFDPIDCNEDAFCQWLRQEQAKEMSQWLPLRSTNPEHQVLINDAPDRAVLTEEIQPFLFQVPRVMRLTLVLNLLKFAGLQWLNSNKNKARHDTATSENLYADSFEDEYDELVKPILSAMNSGSTESILLTTVQKRDLLQQALLNDVCVSESALADASKVAFIQNVLMRFLDILHNEGDHESMQLVKYLWIAYEAHVVSYGDGDDTGLQYARQLCQKLMESDSTTSSHTPGASADVVLMFAYAKLELRAGNLRQVNRICDKTLQSLALHSSSDAKMDRSFHALLFLRARNEIWRSGLETSKTEQYADEELRKLMTLYVLWSVWQPQNERDSLEKLEKRFSKQSAKLKQHLHDSLIANRNVKTAVVEKYRLELEIATQQRIKQSRRSGNCVHLKQSDWFFTIGYCVYNLCLAIYTTAGFQAACSEFQAQMSMLYWDLSPSDDRWLHLCSLEFVQQHQLSSSFPIVAPRDWRFAVGEAVERFPHDPLLLRLYVDAETSNTMSQSLRRHFQSVRTRWQRHFDSPLIVEWLFALLCEFSRLERSATKGEAEPGSSLRLSTTSEPSRCCLFHKFGSNLTGVERIRRVFQEMVENVRTQGSALCWRLYVRFEVQMGKVDTARRVFYRGLAKCPWSKALYLDGVRVLRPYLNAAECKELVDFMAAKELHVRVEEEDEDENEEDE